MDCCLFTILSVHEKEDIPMATGKKFQDIEYSRVDLDSPEKKMNAAENSAFVNIDDDAEKEMFADSTDDLFELLADDQEEEGQKPAGPPVWKFEYYQQYFDVDTGQVLRRIVGSMIPYPRVHANRQTIRPKPDLYGPFWVCTTLIFAIAIAGNLFNFIHYQGKDVHWRYDFKKVTFAATAIYGYWWIIPIIVWGLLWLRKTDVDLTFVDVLCIYGYSLSIYVPISLLWLVPLVWLQWLLVTLGALLSGAVLVMTMWPIVRQDSKRVAAVIMATILILHCALALGFLLYFFHAPEATPNKPGLSTQSPTTVRTTKTPPRPRPTKKG